MIRKIYRATMLFVGALLALYFLIPITVFVRHAPPVIWDVVSSSVPAILQFVIDDPVLLLYFVPTCIGFWIYAFGFPTSETTNDNVRRGRHMTSLEEIRGRSRSRPPSRPQRPPQRSHARTSTVKQPNRQQRSRRK